jgi:hypothetical protein
VDLLLSWITAHHTLLTWLAVLSVVTFIGSLVIIPCLILYIPESYFMHPRRKSAKETLPFPGLRLLMIVLKNMVGALFVLAGIAMLVLPGQGLLTILIGLMFLDFPGKYTLERKIIRQKKVLRTINWMRAKANRPPVQV